jgi:hypothetical protein
MPPNQRHHDLIKAHLENETLTSKQLTVLLHPDQRRYLTTDETPEKHGGVYSQLMTLLRRKDIDRYKVNPRANNTPFLYRVPGNKKWTEQSYKHESDCASVYMAYALAGMAWDWGKVEFKNDKLFPDRFMELQDGPVIYWEIDRGTEDYERIGEKIDKYLALRQKVDYRFHVIFTTTNYRLNPLTGTFRQSDRARANGIFDILSSYGFKGNQFLVALHSWVISRPLDPVFVCPTRPQGLALSELGASPAALAPQNVAVSG